MPSAIERQVRLFRIACVIAVAVAGCEPQPSGVSFTLVRQLSWLDADDVLYPQDLVVVDDRIYLLDEGLPGLAVIDTSGRLVRTFGGKGEGPGEFSRISGIAVANDGSVAIADAGNSRITIIAPTDSVVSDIRVTGRLGALAFDRSGLLHVSRGGVSRDGNGTVEVIDATGVVRRSYGEYRSRPHILADARHNAVSFARDDDVLWWLYPFRGDVGISDDDFRLTAAPQWANVDTLQPYINVMGEGPTAPVMITRLAAFDDIAVGDDRIYLLKLVFQPEGAQSHIFIASSSGTLLGEVVLSRPAERIAVDDGRLYALRVEVGDGPAIDVYTIDEVE